MPRPKRTKVAPSAPTKIHTERVAQVPIPASAAQKQKDLFSPASSSRINTGSDDSDGLVVSRRKGQTKAHSKSHDYTMSGALALEDIGTTRLKPPSVKTRAELTRIARDADHAQAMSKARAGGAKTQEGEVEGPEEIPSSFPAEPSSTRKALSSSSSSQFSAIRSNHGRVRSKLQETPRMQSSILSEVAFKKRPRQPSLLQMVQSQNQSRIEPDDDDMYNFLPDDESTPLIKTLSQPIAQHRSSSSGHMSGSRKRKQKTPEIQVPASQSQSTMPRSSSLSPSPSIEQEDPYDISVEEDQLQPSLPRHRSTQTPQPQIFSDTLAPPQSSSPVRPEPKSTHRKPKKAPKKSIPHPQLPKRKEHSPAPSPISPTSTQVSPIRPPKSAKPLTTATLQNLLPRRRTRKKPKGDYDVPSSSEIELDQTGLAEDEDELSFHATKIRKKKAGTKVPKSVVKKKDATTKKTSTKTYTRKSIVLSDDEEGNENESDGGGGGDENAGVERKKPPALDGRAKAEMRRLADKFREVDEYSLDFEDMTGSSSQLKDAR